MTPAQKLLYSLQSFDSFRVNQTFLRELWLGTLLPATIAEAPEKDLLEEVVKVNGKVDTALGVLGARRVGVTADARVHVTQHVHARTLLVLQSQQRVSSVSAACQ